MGPCLVGSSYIRLAQFQWVTFLSISSLRVLSTSCVLVMRALRFTFPISRWGFAGRKSADAALHEKVLPADSQCVSF